MLTDEDHNEMIPYSGDAVITFLNGMTRSKIPRKDYPVTKDLMADQISHMVDMHYIAMHRFGLVPHDIRFPRWYGTKEEQNKAAGKFKKALASGGWVKRFSWLNLIRNRMEVSLKNNATWLEYASCTEALGEDSGEGTNGGSRLPEFHD